MSNENVGSALMSGGIICQAASRWPPPAAYTWRQNLRNYQNNPLCGTVTSPGKQKIFLLILVL